MVELIRMAAHGGYEPRPPRFSRSSPADGHYPRSASSGRFWWHWYETHQADEVLHERENPDAQQNEYACHDADARAYLFNRAPPFRRHRSAAQAHGYDPRLSREGQGAGSMLAGSTRCVPARRCDISRGHQRCTGVTATKRSISQQSEAFCDTRSPSVREVWYPFPCGPLVVFH